MVFMIGLIDRQMDFRVSAKTQPNDMSFGLTPFISMSVLFVPGFIFGVTG